MSRLNLLGFICVGGGIVLVVFQAISSMMTAGEISWKGKTLISVFGEEAFSWVDGLSLSFLQSAGEFIVTTELYMLLIGLGVLFLLAGMVFHK